VKKTLKGYLTGVISTLVILGGIAYATTGSEMIEVFYNNIKVYKDNILCDLKDSNGTTVEPFIYNGSTYVPLRAISEALGVKVDWDGDTQTINMYDNILPDETYLLDVCPPYETHDASWSGSYGCYTYYASEAESFSMAGEKYTNGMTLAGNDSNNTYALFNLNGKYKSIDMVIAPIDGVQNPSSIAFIVDGKSVAEHIVYGEDYPKKISVPLNYGLQLKIVTIPDGGRGDTGLGNITVE